MHARPVELSASPALELCAAAEHCLGLTTKYYQSYHVLHPNRTLMMLEHVAKKAARQQTCLEESSEKGTPVEMHSSMTQTCVHKALNNHEPDDRDGLGSRRH